MIPGKIRVPTLILHAKWDKDPPRYLALNVGQLKNTSSERMIELRRNSYGGDGEELDAVLPRADRPPVLPSHFRKSARIIEHDRQSISAWCRQEVFKAPRLTTILDAPRRKLVCCCASHKIKVGQSCSVTAEKTGFLLNSRYLRMGFDFDPSNLDRGALPCRSWRIVRDAGNRIDFRGNRP